MEIPACVKKYIVAFEDGDSVEFITDRKDEIGLAITAAIHCRRAEMEDGAKRYPHGDYVGTMIHRCHDIVFGDWKIKNLNSGWRLYAPDWYFSTAIKHCPFCGRRLPQPGEILYKSMSPEGVDIFTVSPDGAMTCWRQGDVNGDTLEGK